MIPLVEDLQTPKNSLKEFARLTGRVLSHIENVITGKNEIRGYNIYSSTSAGITKYTRPVNRELFFLDCEKFMVNFTKFQEILGQLERRRGDMELDSSMLRVIDSVTYTIQQAAGVGLDLLVNPNSARKHVGNRFEELVRLIVAELGIINRKIVLKIPYSDDGKDVYSCETDLVFSPYPLVRSHSTYIDPKEVVVSLKTSSKDRMGKIFIDKLLMKEFVGHDIKVVGIFLNDVQRKGTDNISFTFVSGLFMVYTKFLTQSEGMYFVDLPPMARKAPYNKYIFPFSKFVSRDIWELVLRP